MLLVQDGVPVDQLQHKLTKATHSMPTDNCLLVDQFGRDWEREGDRS